MHQTKIIFFDVDGTLVNPATGKVSEITKETLHRLQANGIRICLATGRAPVSLPAIDGVEFDAYVTFNGALGYTKTETIFSHPLPEAAVQQVIRNATELGRPVSIATRECLAANGSDQDLADYYTMADLVLEVTENFDEVVRQEVFQVMLGCREWDFPAILKDVEGAKITAAWHRAADVIPTEGGKGTGIGKILAYYGLKKEESMAFGDGNNDLDMMGAVGIGVAMGNASPKLKELADDICGHVAEEGIYHYCLEHGLI